MTTSYIELLNKHLSEYFIFSFSKLVHGILLGMEDNENFNYFNSESYMFILFFSHRHNSYSLTTHGVSTKFVVQEINASNACKKFFQR